MIFKKCVLCFAGGTPALVGSAPCSPGQQVAVIVPLQVRTVWVCVWAWGVGHGAWVRVWAGAPAHVRAHACEGWAGGGYVLLAHVCEENSSLS